MLYNHSVSFAVEFFINLMEIKWDRGVILTDDANTLKSDEKVTVQGWSI